jgi:sulfate permease, SulP family
MRKVQSQTLLPNLVSGLTIGLMASFIALSFASLIFSGSLEQHMARGSSLLLVSAAIFFIGLGLFTSLHGGMPSVQDVSSVLLATIVAGAVAGLPSAAVLPTALAMLVTATALTGLVVLAVGWLRLAGLIRYIPYPVIGGFLAATGWMLVVGAFSITSDHALSWANLPMLLQPDQLALWLPALALALVMMVALRYVSHPLAMPTMLVGAVMVFYLALLALGIPLERAAAMGLFFPSSAGILWQPVTPAELALVDWSAVLGQAGNVGVLIGITLVGLTLNISAVELALGREFDLNREFRTVGGLNLLSGLGGGALGYQSLAFSAINRRMQASGRAPYFFAGLVLLGALFTGSALLAYLPRFLVGGLLLFLGFDFLYDWVWSGFRRFALVEYSVVLMILVVIVTTNFLNGVVLGLLTMTVMFVVSYSRTSAVLRSYSAADVRSTVSRTFAERALLAERGERAQVIELQGFLFFGTASALVEQVKKRLADTSHARITCLLIDFRHVTGIDSSTVLSFEKIRRQAQEYSFQLVLTGMTAQVRQRLQLASPRQSGGIEVVDDLDHGLEWCENFLLGEDASPRVFDPARFFRAAGLPEELSGRMDAYTEPGNAAAGDTLLERGQLANDLLIILEGQATIYRTLASGQKARARTIGPGSMAGEIGLYLSAPRTASVVADEPTCFARITRAALERMEREDPPLAMAFHQMVVRMLSERQSEDERTVFALRR